MTRSLPPKERDALVEAAMQELEFCGCGEPEPVLGRLLQLLAEFDKPHEERTLYKFESGWMFCLPLYVLDQHDLIEHGGSVGGGWITDKGREFLAKYNPAFAGFP